MDSEKGNRVFAGGGHNVPPPPPLVFGAPKKPGLDRVNAAPLDLSFWSFLTFLHHGIEEVERHLL